MKKRKQNKKVNIKTIAMIVLAVILVSLFGYKIVSDGLGSVQNSTENGLDEFALCLSEKGIAMYGAEWCSHCKNQKSLFGDSFGLINYIDCDQNRETCVSEGIRGYPTWKINGQSYPGEQPLERLASLSGCQL